MKARHYAIIGIAAYIIFLINSLPAALVLGAISKSLQQVNIQNIQGTIWHGHARRITIANHVLEDVNWSFCSWRLFTAEACVDLKASYQNKPVLGQLGIGITGKLVARNMRLALDAKQLGNMAGLPLGELGGQLSLKLESASWQPETVPNTVGVVLWNNATITVAETASLGNVTITFNDSSDFALTAVINNNNGQVAINGNTSVKDDGKYQLELKLTPNASATENLRSSLGMFATKQNDGSFLLKNTGNLKQLGIM